MSVDLNLLTKLTTLYLIHEAKYQGTKLLQVKLCQGMNYKVREFDKLEVGLGNHGRVKILMTV